MPLLASSPSGPPVYQSRLVAVDQGVIYVATPAPFNYFTAAAGQTNTLLSPTNDISATYMNQHVYFVDGINIVDLNMLTNTATYLNSTTGSAAVGFITGSTLSSILLVNGAAGYTATPTVVITGGGGVSAAATATMTTASGTVTLTGVTITNHGSGYTSPPQIYFTGGGLVDAPLPLGATGIQNWRNRLMYWGNNNNPQVLVASRAGNAGDYNYGATDSAAAFEDNPAQSGRIGEPIISVMPYTDDYCMVGCSHSMFMYQGDPAAGGTNTTVSQDMGVTGIAAWCIDPEGQLYFIATGGLFSVKPIWEFYRPPENLTKSSYNQFFTNIDPSQQIVSLQWDSDYHYLHMFVTPADDQTVGIHLVYDARNKGLWPEAYPLNFGPICTALYLGANQPNFRQILLGGWDGWVRYEDTSGGILDDDGTAISSYITFGPISPFPDASALITTTIDLGELDPEGLATSNWYSTATLNAGPDAFSVTEGTARNTFSVVMDTDRRQKTFRQRLRGRFFSLNIANDTDLTYFSFESADLEFMQGGFQRPTR
jgi:hypothetical protein